VPRNNEYPTIVFLVEGSLDAVLYRYLAAAIARRLGANCQYCSIRLKEQQRCPSGQWLRKVMESLREGYTHHIDASRWLECIYHDKRLVTAAISVEGVSNVEKLVAKMICGGQGAEEGVTYIGVVDADTLRIVERTRQLLERPLQRCDPGRWTEPRMLCDAAIATRHRRKGNLLYMLVQGIDVDSEVKMFNHKGMVEDYIPLIIEYFGLEPSRIATCTRMCESRCEAPRDKCVAGKRFKNMLMFLYCQETPPAALRKIAEKFKEEVGASNQHEALMEAVYRAFRRASPCIVRVIEKAVIETLGGSS